MKHQKSIQRPGYPAAAIFAFLLAAGVLVGIYLYRVPALAASATYPGDAGAAAAPPVTVVSSDIVTDTTWTRANSPYQVAANISVLAGAILTVEGGVEVRFQQLRGLSVEGRLMAVGTASQPITFTGTTQQPGWWRGIVIRGTVQAPNTGSRLSYTIVEYGGLTSNDANLYLTDATVAVDNSAFRNGGSHGIHGFSRGTAHISSVAFSNNAGYAVLFTDGAVNPVLEKLTASGNGSDGVGLGGYSYLRGDHVWEATGIPYVLVGSVEVVAGATLTIEPGVEVRATENTGLTAGGKLSALGTATQPITFTGTTEQPGWWRGIAVYGTTQAPAAGRLNYATVEYGGYGGGANDANVSATNGKIAISHSVIRYSAGHGLYISTGGGGSVVETSHIVTNTRYGVFNLEPTKTVVAPNNWWGAATGPAADGGCNPGGTGSRTNAGVSFLPFLTSPSQDPGPLAPGQARILSLIPQRWFAPADGNTRVWVPITLRDGNGDPLPGRTVYLTTTLGTAVSGGTTDARGETFAYLTSKTPGDALLTAGVSLLDSCEDVRSPSATVTFTAAGAEEALVPGAAAPYLSPIEISPLPVVRGVPTTLRVRLTNSNAFPITVDATFGYAKFGMGLTFGPIGEVRNQTIPAQSIGVVEVPWTPVVSGYQCFEVQLSWRQASGVSMAQSGGLALRKNLNTYQGPRIPAGPDGKQPLNQAREWTSRISSGGMLVEGAHLTMQTGLPTPSPTIVPDIMLHSLLDKLYNLAKRISQGLGFDPPRQDFRTIATLERIAFTPMQPGPNVPAARAAANNALMEAAVDWIAKYRAAGVSFDRYGGAAAAEGDCVTCPRLWSSQQASAYVYYLGQSASAMTVVADRMDALLQEWRDEGIVDVVIPADAIRAYQQWLRTQGFTAAEMEVMRQLGLTDEEIEQEKQQRLASDPELLAGSLMKDLEDTAGALRRLGQALTKAFGQSAKATAAEAAANNLVRIHPAEIPFEVGNPLTQTTTIELRTRRLSLPDDWSVTTTPVTVSLAPGAQTTVTATVQPGTTSVQGQQPRVAVEGYANGELLSGVVLDVMIPDFVPFDGKLRAYLPYLSRSFEGGW